MRGFPLNENVKEGYPLKRLYFADIGSSSVKTVADRYIHVAYHKSTGHGRFSFINIDDPEQF